MNYQDAIAESMIALARDPMRRFLGYNVKYGGKANGTLKAVNNEQLIEMPVAENLVAGVAAGLSLEGFKPVVWYERFDFVLNALDAIVNHIDKIGRLSMGQFNPRVIFRVNVGGTARPLYTGPTHVQDFTEAVRKMVAFPVRPVTTPDEVRVAYSDAVTAKSSFMVVEYRDCYE